MKIHTTQEVELSKEEIETILIEYCKFNLEDSKVDWRYCSVTSVFVTEKAVIDTEKPKKLSNLHEFDEF